MTKIIKIFCVSAFSFLCLFAALGYAEVSDTLSIIGDVDAEVPDTIFISDVTLSDVTAGGASNMVSAVYPTSINSSISLTRSNSSVTYTVTVFNNTGLRYEYIAAKYANEFYSNENISFHLTNLSTGEELLHGDIVEPGEHLTFTVEFSYKDGYTPSGEEELSSLINYEFLPSSSLEPIYIRKVEIVRGTASYTEESIGTNLLNTTFNLPASGSVVYKITMNNRSADDYGYYATIANLTLGDNNKISYSLWRDAALSNRLLRRDLLPAATDEAHGSIVFYLSAQANDSASGLNRLNGVFDIRFITPVDSIPEPGDGGDDGQLAVENALDKFKKILNTPNEYSDFLSLLDNVPSGRNNSYVAYVPGAPSSDKTASLELFDGQLQISIDGELQTVYFLIKREDVTGDGRNDFTVYMTTNDLSKASTVSDSAWGGMFYRKYNPSLAVIYAATFTEISDGEWIRLGDLYKGDGRICDYDGGMQNYGSSLFNTVSVPTGSGSLHTDTWVTSEAYYGVPSGSALSDVLTKKAFDLSTLRQLIARAEAITTRDDYIFLYTKDSRDMLDAALITAKTLIANNSYVGNQTVNNQNTQAEIVSYCPELEKAIDGLVDAA